MTPLTNEAAMVRGKAHSFLEFSSWQGAIDFLIKEVSLNPAWRTARFGLVSIQRQWGWTWMLWLRSNQSNMSFTRGRSNPRTTETGITLATGN